MIIEKISFSGNWSNCYLVGNKREMVVIDSGKGGARVVDKIISLTEGISSIIITHGHFDHIAGNELLKEEFSANISISVEEQKFLTDPTQNLSQFVEVSDITGPPADVLLQEGEEITVADWTFTVLLTPGHSPGSICLYCEKEDVLFCGDLIFRNGVGRTDLPGGNLEKLRKSINKKVLVLPENTRVFPGHGEETTVGRFKNDIWQEIC